MATIIGVTPRDGSAEILPGTPDADTIIGSDGIDLIYAGDGNDTVNGGDGNDSFFPSSSDPSTWGTGGHSGNDELFGGNGNDTFHYSYDRDGVTVWGDGIYPGDLDGNDRIFTGAGGDVIIGGNGNDWIETSYGDDIIYGDNGAQGGIGNDTIIGGWGADYIRGGAGFDVFMYVDTNDSYAKDLNGKLSADTIRDFDQAQDHIYFYNGPDPSSFAWSVTSSYGSVEQQLDTAIEYATDLFQRWGSNYVFLWNDQRGFLIADVDGDHAYDYSIILDGLTSSSQFGPENIITSLPAAEANPTQTRELINHAADVTTADHEVRRYGDLAASSLFSTTDADGDAITSYAFYDATADATSGHFTVAGVAQNSFEVIQVSAAQLAETRFQAGTTTDDLWVAAYDGTAWSDWKEFHLTPPVNLNPVVAATDQNVAKNTSLAASSLFSVSDDDGDAITQYHFWDATADATSGHFAINGVMQGANQIIDVSATDLAHTTFQTGTTTDDLWVQAFDGTVWSDWKEFHLSTSVPGQTLIGTAGSDNLVGADGNDRLEGGDGMDFLTGGAGADQLLGGGGTDFLYIDAEDTLINGGDGFDYLYLDSSKSYGADFKVAGTNVESVSGTFASDSIDGSGVTYGLYLNGNYGNDVLIGGAGNDRIDGSANNDILTGSAGSDTFLFAGHWGNDTLTDFTHGQDVLDMTGVSGLTSMSQLSITNTAQGASIAYGGDSIFLQGVAASTLSASDFHLHA